MTRYLISPTSPDEVPAAPPTAQDLNIPAEAFGARTAFGALEPGEQLDPGYWDEANRANSTRASELQNQFLDRQREILHTGPDAYLNKTGRNAVLAARDVLSRLEAARQDTIDQAANEAQRRLLTSALGEHRITEHYRVGTHAGEQSLEWQKQTVAERLNQLRQQAALDYGDPDSIEAYARASESAARERARTMKFGPDAAETFQEMEGARSSIWRQAIEAALGKIDTKSAIILYNRAADRMTAADTTALTPQIDAAKEHQAGQDYLATLPVPDIQDFAELEVAHQAAVAQNETDWPNDDSQRATNRHLIDIAFGQKKRDLLQVKADLHRATNDWLAQPNQARRPPLAVWASLNSEERSKVDDILRQNSEMGTAEPSAPMNTPARPERMAPIKNYYHGRELLESFIPGARYSKLANEALHAGNYDQFAIYGVASLLDAAIGVLTLGIGSAAARPAIDGATGALKRAIPGAIKALQEAAIAAGSRLRRSSTGEFSIIDWTGYPDHLPKPVGPFRLIDGVEYKTNRDLADKINRAWRRRDPVLQGKEVHEIHTIKFGGNPSDALNKMVLSPQEHRLVSAWWLRFKHYVENAR